MSTANYLNVKTHLSDLKCGSDKDTISEASESGTTNSLSSSEDLQKLAVILGLQSAEDVYQERFRVDRRRLECMLADNLEESQTASGFFHQIMSETNTLINWPARLKIGARSKKEVNSELAGSGMEGEGLGALQELRRLLELVCAADPHVRVAGRCEDVRLARERIMQLLDTRSNRVTMKVDVSYTDHSHIIGKGGLTIKRVMEETGCHIHFPDSNRSSANEKSNQVSVAGDMDRVEKARARVRALTPLIFSFELPIMSASKPVPDVGSPYALQIQEKYNVQVMLRTRPKLHATLVVVKGVQWEVQNTMEATKLLVDYMCGSIASQTLIQMSLEISPIHHDVVLGANANQLKVIMKNTGAQIMFPDAGDPNIPPLKKSNVTITGSINDVYMARQQLVGSLPLVVIFDMPEEGRTIEQDLVSRVMQTYNVNIQVRRKLRQGLVSVVIKGVERCAGDIYEARRELLGGNEPEVKVDIPESYHIPAAALSAMADIATFSPFSPSHANVPQSPLNCSPMYSLDYSNYPSPIYHHNPPTPGGYPSPMSPVAALSQPGFPQSWAVIPPSPQAQPNPFPYPAMPVSNANSMYVKQGTGNSWNAAGGSMMSRVHQQMLLQQYQHQQAHASQQTSQPSSLHQLLNISGPGSSGYQSNFTGSTVSLDTHSISGGDCSNVVSPSVSPISNKTHSPTRSTDTDHSQDIATMLSELTGAEIDRRAVGCEKKTLEHLQAKLSPLADYHKMKSDASKAMQEEIGSGYRVPTTRWSGYYFSHTSPSALKLGDIKHQTPESKPWNKSDLVRPNIAEMVSPAGKQSGSPAVGDGNTPTTPTPQQRKCHYQQLSNLLADIGLLKYVELFQQHEIDISTFASLNEADLAEIGVTAFGARRKMLLTIADLKQQRAFKPPGPSAQRKLISSPPQYNTEALQNQNKW